MIYNSNFQTYLKSLKINANLGHGYAQQMNNTIKDFELAK